MEECVSEFTNTLSVNRERVYLHPRRYATRFWIRQGSWCIQFTDDGGFSIAVLFSPLSLFHLSLDHLIAHMINFSFISAIAMISNYRNNKTTTFKHSTTTKSVALTCSWYCHNGLVLSLDNSLPLLIVPSAFKYCTCSFAVHYNDGVQLCQGSECKSLLCHVHQLGEVVTSVWCCSIPSLVSECVHTKSVQACAWMWCVCTGT